MLTENDDSAKLEYKENTDMWLEAVYCANYESDYDDLAAFLTFGAEAMEMSEEKQEYLSDTIDELAFRGETAEHEALLADETDAAFSVTLTYDEEADDKYIFCAAMEIADTYLSVGDLEDGRTVEYFSGSEENSLNVFIADSETQILMGSVFIDYIYADSPVTLSYSSEEISIGEEYVFDGEGCSESVYLTTDNEAGDWNTVEITEALTSFTADEAGVYCFMVYNEGEYNILILEAS